MSDDLMWRQFIKSFQEEETQKFQILLQQKTQQLIRIYNQKLHPAKQTYEQQLFSFNQALNSLNQEQRLVQFQQEDSEEEDDEYYAIRGKKSDKYHLLGCSILKDKELFKVDLKVHTKYKFLCKQCEERRNKQRNLK